MQTIVGRTATVAENATLATATSMPGTFPADKQAGDIVIAVYGFSCTPAQFTGPGAGWTLAVTPTDNGSAEIVAAYYQFDPPSVPVGTQSSGVATRCTLIVHGYGGVDPNNPIDVAAAITTALGASLVANGVTTVTPGAKVVSGYMYDTWSRTVTIPAGMNLVASYGAASVGRALAVADETDPTPGATGTRTWTYTPAGSLNQAAYVLAL